MTIVIAITLVIISYIIGSANSSIIITKIMGSDIREHGSGNAGATNMLRTHGKRLGILALVLDVLKGVLAVGLGMLAEHILRINGVQEDIFMIGIKYYAAAAVVLGHNFPVFFGLRGGKGIATSGAIIAMLDWRVGIITVTIALGLIALTRYVSLGSIVAAASYPVSVALFVFWLDAPMNMMITWTAFATALFIGVLAVCRHSANIVRLCKGTESKLGQKKSA